MNKILDGKLVAAEFKNYLEDEITKIEDKLKLVVIQVGNNEASNIYINNKKKLCAQFGIEFVHIKYETADDNKIIEEITKLNKDDSVTGILIQLPLPDNINTKKIINKIIWNKDVDGLTDINFIKLINNQDGIIPCTVLGILKMFEYYNIDIESKNITVLGRSRLVGLPLSISLLNKNATVTICHSKTDDITKYTKKADIVVSAVGIKYLINKDMIKENAILIDVGITKEDKMYGDIDFANVLDKCLMISPVPGGVGPMTTIMLINNIIKCKRMQ